MWLEDGFVVLEWEGGFWRRFNLMLVAGNMYVVAGAFPFGMVIWFGFFLNVLVFVELMEGVGVVML